MKKLLYASLALALLVLASSGSLRAQTLYKQDSAVGVWSRITGTIAQGATVPVKITVLSGDGAKFSRIGVPLLIQIHPWSKATNYWDTLHYEVDSVSEIIGDTLVIAKRALANSYQLAWTNGARVDAVGGFQGISILFDQLAQKLTGGLSAVLPDSTGYTDSVLAVKPGGGYYWKYQPNASAVTSYNTRTGAVVPVTGDYSFSQISGTAGVTQGGTGLTSIATNKLLYGSATNTFGPLTVGPGLEIDNDTLFAVYADTTGHTNEVLTVIPGGGIDWSTAGSGTVTSVGVSGGTTGFAFANTPITGHGDMIMSGTLGIANGGTGATSAAQAIINLLPDMTGKAGWHLGTDGTSPIWDTLGGGGGGITSVGLSMPAEATVSGSPLTGTGGTISVTWATEAANKFFAGPTTGAPATPTFRSIAAVDVPSLDVAKITTGVFPIARGGTNSGTALSGSTIMISNGSAIVQGAAGSPGQTLHGNASGAPTYSYVCLDSEVTCILAALHGGTGFGSYSVGDILWASGASAFSKLALGSNGKVLKSNGSAPTYGFVDFGELTGTATSGQLPVVPPSKGGTGQSATPSDGDLLVGSGGVFTPLPIGLPHRVLTVNNAGTGLLYSYADMSYVQNVLGVANGGTGQSAYTDGQLLIGNTATGLLTKATITAGTGVTVTNGNGSITIAATGTGGTVTSVDVSGGSTGLSFTGGPITTTGTITAGGTLGVGYGGTGLASYSVGDLLYATGATTLSKLAVSTDGKILQLSGGVPTWQTVSASLTNWTEALTTAAPNAGVPVASLTVTNAATDVDAAIVPKGSGAFLVSIPDNTATGGNKRGDQAVDLSRARDNADEVASGNSSTIAGGKSNKATDIYATVGGGYFNYATAQYTNVTGGYDNVATANYSTVAGGSDNTSSQLYAAILGGANNTASGNSSVVLGGHNDLASGTYATATGYRSTATGYGQLVLGQYNTVLPTSASGTFTAADPALIIGNGDGTAQATRSYAMLATYDGQVYLGGRWSSSDATTTESVTGKLNLGVANATTFATVLSATQAASRTYTIQDAGTNADFVMTAGNQTVAGNKTFSGATTTSGTLTYGSAEYLNVSAPHTTNYTVGATDQFVLADATSGPITITLQATPTVGRHIYIVKIDVTANAVTVARNGNDFLDGASDITLASAGSIAELVYTGSSTSKWAKVSVQ